MTVKQKVLRTFDLHPDGVQVVVDWGSFRVGTSIFVPCINTTLAIDQAKQIANQKGWEIKAQTRIENGHLGVRIWRTL
jgi:hypothetical protein